MEATPRRSREKKERYDFQAIRRVLPCVIRLLRTSGHTLGSDSIAAMITLERFYLGLYRRTYQRRRIVSGQFHSTMM